MRIFLIVILTLAMALPASAAISDIATVRASINEADGTGAGTTFTIQGTVTGLIRPSRNQYTIQDGTGAIITDDTAGNMNTDLGGDPQVGDILTITGATAFYNGLVEYIPGAAGTALISSGNALPLPLIVADWDDIDDAEESMLLGMKNINLDDATGTWANGTSYTLDDGTAPTGVFRLQTDTTGWAATASPAADAPFDIIGVGGQYDGSNPYDSGYQIIARCDRQGDGTTAYNGNADTGPDAVSAGTLPVELSVFSSD